MPHSFSALVVSALRSFCSRAAAAGASLSLLFCTVAVQAAPGDLDSGFNPNPSGTVNTTSIQADGRIVIGGFFNRVGTTDRNRIARLSAAGGLEAGFDPDADTGVYAIVAQANGQIIVGGAFTALEGNSGIARLNSDGSVDNTVTFDFDGVVNAIAVDAQGRLLVGGAFTSVGEVSRSYLARLNADGSLDASFDANVGGVVDTIAVQADGKILIGGRFTSVGGETRKYIARVGSDDGAVDPDFAPDTDNYVESILVLPDGRLVIAGNFSYLGTYPAWALRDRMARLSASGSVDGDFDPNVDGGAINSMALQADGKIVIAGAFTSVGGTARNRIARVNTDGSLDTDFDPDAGNVVNSVAIQADGRIVVGGVFTQMGGTTRNRVARLENDAASSALTTPDSTTVQWLRSGATAEVSQVTFERSLNNGETWDVLGSGTRIDGGWELSGVVWGGGLLRARGRTAGGRYNGSSGLVAHSFPSTVVSVSPPASGTYKVGDEVDFTINWNEPVNIAGEPALGLTVGSNSRSANYASGTGTATTVFRYVVQSGDIDSGGVVVGSLALNGGTITNSSATAANTALNSIGSTVGVLVDGVAPRVASIARQTPASSPTNADTLVFRVTFDEPVANVDANDFTVSGTTATITDVASAGGNAYDVTISGGDLAALNGTVTLAFAGSRTIADAVGNALTNTTPTGTNDHSYDVLNNVAPSDLALFPATIDESLAAAGATVGTLTTTDADLGDTHTYALADGEGDTHNASFVIDGAALKIGGSALAAGSYTVRVRTTDAGSASLEKSFDVSVPDDVAPNAPSTPDLAAVDDSGLSNSDNHTRIVTPAFAGTAEPGALVKLFDGDTQIGSDTADGLGHWTIVASELTDGVPSITATATDAASNVSDPSAALAITIETVAPVITAGAPSAALTRSGPVSFAIDYTDANFAASTLTLDDLALNRTGTADGTLALTGGDTSYTVTVTDITGDGTLGLAVAAGTASDLAGNLAPALAATDTFSVDNTVPSVASIQRENPATLNTTAATLTWRVVFDGDVTGVDLSDFTVTTLEGDVGATLDSITTVNASTYDVTATVGTGQARLRLELNDADTGILDVAGSAIASGFAEGEIYLSGVSNVFETLRLANDGAQVVTLATAVAQRFTTAGAAPLSVTTVAASIGAVHGASPAVGIHRDEAGEPGPLVASLENPDTLTPGAVNLWTSNLLLEADTSYWLVFAATAGDYEIAVTDATGGGLGDWLGSADDYAYATGLPDALVIRAGALHVAIGATNVPTITSALTASGTYLTEFSYQITATNTPTSFAATGLPDGFSLDPATGEITGVLAQTGRFEVGLTATNESGTGSSSTLELTIGKASLIVTANDVVRSYGAGNPPLTVRYEGFLGGDTVASLTTPPAAATAADPGTSVGGYAINVSGGVSDNYAFIYEPGLLTIEPDSQVIRFASPDPMIIGQSTTLSATATSGLPVSFSVISGPATLSGVTLTTTGVGLVTVRASQGGSGNYDTAPNVDRSFNVLVGEPTVTTPEEIPTPAVGGTAELIVTNSNPNVNYQWQRNGSDLPNGSGASLTLSDVQPPTAGLYTYTATVPGGGGGTSEPVIVGLSTDEKVIGTGEQVLADVVHPNGNVYDQVLLEGNGASVTASANKVTRLSFVDLTNDIVQVEFSGAGTLSVVMDDASQPAPPINYNQENVDYVRGHVGLVITGANETSNLSIISVGPITAVNQSLFKEGVTYDGVADVAFVAIQSANGKFGGIRTGNVSYYASQGFTGVYAPGVEVAGPINIGDVTAFDSATPVLVFGAIDTVSITGGSLEQANGQSVKVSGIAQVRFVDGTTSQGGTLPAQQNKGVLIEDGVDVTDLIVDNP